MKGGQQAKPRETKAAVVALPAHKSSRRVARRLVHVQCAVCVLILPALCPARCRYKEVQEQRFWQERLGTRDVDELGIDTNASFLAEPLLPLPAGQPPAAAAPAPPPAAPALKPSRNAPPTAAPGRPAPKAGGVPIIIIPSG